MKAVLLAAGKGDRLGDITLTKPKPMIKINDKPVLEHNLEMCKNAGINDIFINLHHLPDLIRNYFGDGSKFGVNITYNFEQELLGTAGALIPFQDNLHDTPFFVIYGDNHLCFDLIDLKLFNEKMKADISILFYWCNNVRNSGIAEFDSKDRINKFVEKPLDTNYNNDWVNAGVYYIQSTSIIDLIQPKDDFGYDIFPKLLKMKYDLYGLKASVDLIAIDTPELLLESSKKFEN